MESRSISQHDELSSRVSSPNADEKLSTPSSERPEETLESQQMAQALAGKAAAIRKACDSRDVEALVSYATTEGGLIEDELRQRACK